MRMVASRFLRFRCSSSIGFKPWVSVPSAQRQIALPARLHDASRQIAYRWACPARYISYDVKKPSESKYPWDYLKLLQTIPADEAFRPLDEGGCRLAPKG
jgi:hypothetical protein